MEACVDDLNERFSGSLSNRKIWSGQGRGARFDGLRRQSKCSFSGVSATEKWNGRTSDTQGEAETVEGIWTGASAGAKTRNEDPGQTLER